LAPTVILLALFSAYPFVKGIQWSVTNSTVGNPGHFVGLQNFVAPWHDDIFRRAVWNTCFYTVVANVLKLGLGLWLAPRLNRDCRGKALMRAAIPEITGGREPTAGQPRR